MYALVEICGKQYKAEKGSMLKVDRIDNPKGEKLVFNSIMMLKDGDDVKIGNPYISGASIAASIEDSALGEKVFIYKYKKRKQYQKRTGHRQKYTIIKIDDIKA